MPFGLVLTAVFGCGYGKGDYSSTFIEHVSVIFSIETAYWTISYEYDVWYNGSSTTDQNNETLTAAYFITLLESYEKGELTLVTTEPTYGYINYLYGMSWIFYGLQYTDTFYIDMVTQYTDSCGYDTSLLHGHHPRHQLHQPHWRTRKRKKPRRCSRATSTKDIPGNRKCGTRLVVLEELFSRCALSDGLAPSIETNTQCVQLGLYYSMYPEMLVPGCSPDMSVTALWNNTTKLSATSSPPKRLVSALPPAFYNYFYSCPCAFKEFNGSCIIKGGDVSIVATSGECGGMEMVEPKSHVVHHIYMKNILNISPITSTVTLTENVQMYTYMMEQIATSGGFISWTVYVETPAPTMITEFTPMVTEEVTGFSTGETAMSTWTGFTTGVPTEATCVISTPEEECAYIIVCDS
ncbi:unnamed protein product, partial [Mesorhabditis belari]|uniref:Uncharacterized protein n=1 Tax=Mesorhabditis belari TaxID=2138241 RepID=A0AAF3FSI6_9BILA